MRVKNRNVIQWLAGLAAAAVGGVCVGDPIAAHVTLAGDWMLDVAVTAPSGTSLKAVFPIDPPPIVKVFDERCGAFPDYQPQAWGGWQKGYALKGVKAAECSVMGALDPLSLIITDAPRPAATAYAKGRDYEAELDWGSAGRLTTGAIKAGQAVYLSYRYALQRIDTVALSADGNSLLLKKGVPDVGMPKPPALAVGERAVVNVYVTGRLRKLGPDQLFPITETAFPEALAAQDKGAADRLLPKTLAKLRRGEKLRILAWGDSVTEASFLPDPERNRWQAQFIARLKAKYPHADITLVTEAWGGHNTNDYLAEPAGAVHNYKERVLGAKPDLILSEFVNDAWLKRDVVRERYGSFLADFNGIGAEWIIITPHYIRPDWMGLASQRNIDDDPRDYVTALREFAATNQVALADVSRRYGRLWRQGIPYLTLMGNNINHPEPAGMTIFADSLINLFP